LSNIQNIKNKGWEGDNLAKQREKREAEERNAKMRTFKLKVEDEGSLNNF